jgi:hypothetical protein
VEKLEWIHQNTSGAGIDGPTIDAYNRWREVEAAKGKMPRFSKRQKYTQVFQDLMHQFRFSLGICEKAKGILEFQ